MKRKMFKGFLIMLLTFLLLLGTPLTPLAASFSELSDSLNLESIKESYGKGLAERDFNLPKTDQKSLDPGDKQIPNAKEVKEVISNVSDKVDKIVEEYVAPEDLLGKILIYKTIDCVGGTPQAGVTFNLYKGDTLVASGQTDSKGQLLLEGIKYGHYHLKEVVPEGYISTIKNFWPIVVFAKSLTPVHVVNKLAPVPEKGAIEIIKKDNEGVAQNGISFKLYQNGELIKTQSTNVEGITVFTELTPGDYQLTEEVPEGYESSLADMTTVTVTANETTRVNVVNTKIENIDDEEPPLGPIDPEDPNKPDDGIVDIDDEKTPTGKAKLPKTGSLSSIWFYGSGFSLLLTGLALKRKVKK